MRYLGIPKEFLNPHYPGNTMLREYSFYEAKQVIEFYEQICRMILADWKIERGLSANFILTSPEGEVYVGETLECILVSINNKLEEDHKFL